jgi:hypothetical protein
MKFTAPRRLHWLLLISAAVIFVDRLTKTWVTLRIPFGGAIPVVPHFLRITHWTNEGAAFSLFANTASPNTVRWTLVCFTLVAALAVRLGGGLHRGPHLRLPLARLQHSRHGHRHRGLSAAARFAAAERKSVGVEKR